MSNHLVCFFSFVAFRNILSMFEHNRFIRHPSSRLWLHILPAWANVCPNRRTICIRQKNANERNMRNENIDKIYVPSHHRRYDLYILQFFSLFSPACLRISTWKSIFGSWFISFLLSCHAFKAISAIRHSFKWKSRKRVSSEKKYIWQNNNNNNKKNRSKNCEHERDGSKT